jgi:Zn-dependent protease
MSDPSPPAPPLFDEYRPIEVYVVAPPPRPRYWIHGALLLVTLFTTLVVGARLEFNFLNNLPAFSMEGALPMFPLGWIWQAPARLLLGIPFAATLMGILLAHEMGHYLYCVRYGVNATLPYFIPAPTLIGTLGAFIRIKSPIRSRDALFDIGIAGPIAGFAVATVVLFFSLLASKPLPVPAPPSDIVFGFPLIFRLMHWVTAHVFGAPGAWDLPLSKVYLHPTAIAAWVGMFATALNLLPGGQLDGGHIVYSISPRAHKHVSRIAVGMLLPMGYFLWPGWFLWALLLGLSGMRHPQVPLWPGVQGKRRWLAVAAFAMLVLTLVPEPFRILGQ